MDADRLRNVDAGELAYQYAIELRKEFDEALDVWSSRPDPSSRTLTVLLTRFIAQLEEQGAVLRKNRVVVHVK